jgi:glutathione S-transferase
MGDIPLGCALARWLNLPVERPAHAHLDAYYRRLQHRDAYRQWVNVLPLT